MEMSNQTLILRAFLKPRRHLQSSIHIVQRWKYGFDADDMYLTVTNGGNLGKFRPAVQQRHFLFAILIAVKAMYDNDLWVGTCHIFPRHRDKHARSVCKDISSASRLDHAVFQ